MKNKVFNHFRIFLFVMCAAGIFGGFHAKRAQAENCTLHVWVSDSKMGDTPQNNQYYTGKWYYLCYEILNSSGKRIGNSYGDYKVSMYQYDPSGKVVNSCTYDNDNNWIGIQSGKTGRFRGHVYVTGAITVDCGVEWYQNDATPTLSVKNSNVALNTETSVRSTVVCSVQGDLSGLSYHLSVSNSNASVVTTSWGSWYADSRKSNLELSARSAGTSVLTVKFLTSNGRLLDTKTIIVTVTESERNTYVVSYDANGGKNAPASQIKKEGVPLLLSAGKPSKSYTLFYKTGCDARVVNREKNCVFKNWNTSPLGAGYYYAPASIYRTDSAATLHAIWENPTISSDDLPKLEREGYCFDGWYLAPAGGTEVKANTKLVSNTTLYAHWTPQSTPSPMASSEIIPSISPTKSPLFTPVPTGEPTCTPSLTPVSTVKPTNIPKEPVDDYSFDKLYYSFTNSRSSFGYSASYKIPLNRYKMFFSDLQAQRLYNRYGTWSGSCFGFAASSIMLNNKTSGDLSPMSFRRAARKVSDLSVTDTYLAAAESMTVTQMLEAMQVMQLDSRIQYMMWNKTYANLVTADLLEKLKNISSGTAEPIVLGLYSEDIGGHAVIPVEISYKSSTEDLLTIYDCNYGREKRYISLFKNSTTGAYTGGWHYYLNDTYHIGSSYGSYISYCDFDTFHDVWKGREKTKMANIVCLTTDGDVDIYDEGRRKVAAIVGGEFASLEASACEIHEVAGGIMTGIDEGDHLFYLTEGTYMVLPRDQMAMQLHITGEEREANMEGTCAGVTFTIDGDTNRVLMQEALDYSIKLTSVDSAKDILMEGEANGKSIIAEQGGSSLMEEMPKPSETIVPMVTDEPVRAEIPVVTIEPMVTVEPITTAESAVTAKPNSTSQVTGTISSSSPTIDENAGSDVSNGSLGIKMIKCKKVKKGKKRVFIKICYKATGDHVTGYEIKVDNTAAKVVKKESYRLKVTRGRKHIIRVRSCYQNSFHGIRYSRWRKIIVKYK